jgi:hypothetical protein
LTFSRAQLAKQEEGWEDVKPDKLRERAVTWILETAKKSKAWRRGKQDAITLTYRSRSMYLSEFPRLGCADPSISNPGKATTPRACPREHFMGIKKRLMSWLEADQKRSIRRKKRCRWIRRKNQLLDTSIRSNTPSNSDIASHMWHYSHHAIYHL